MSVRLERNLDFLRVLCKTKPKQRKLILENSTNDLVLCICEIIDNVLRGTVKLLPSQKKALKKHRKVLRQLSERKGNIKARRAILVQKGGFLPAILAPVLTIAASLLSAALT